jgi:hypothetical protein
MAMSRRTIKWTDMERFSRRKLNGEDDKEQDQVTIKNRFAALDT